MSTLRRYFVFFALACCLLPDSPAAVQQEGEKDQWRVPPSAQLLTRWAKKVQPGSVLPEYPRPQMVRSAWMNLNGLWEYREGKKGESPPFGTSLEGKILVPFPLESALSGVMKQSERLWYRRTFEIPKTWRGSRVLLHFGAVDWETTVHVNGKQVGTHRGGYDAFSFDITDALGNGPAQELIVGVFDPSDGGDQPRGKQVRDPKSIWYTPTTGIWQTVWLESVPQTYIEELVLTPDVGNRSLHVKVLSSGMPDAERIRIRATAQGEPAGSGEGKPGEDITVSLKSLHLWSPSSPFLYDLSVELWSNGKRVDAVKSYFGMRKVEIARDERGVNRIMLNGKFLMQVGPLDQGFWPDGIYTAPTDEALRYDIEVTKRLGFNMTRKHVKVEPARWYYWTDKLGLLVWQDMPSGNNTTAESKEQFELELDRLVKTHRNHPSIIMWVVFNEGWGQYDTERLAGQVKSMDPSRLVNNASGWTDKRAGDVLDIHNYPAPKAPERDSLRAIVLGEFGGLGLAVPDHTWKKEHWGYQGTKDRAELTSGYESFLKTVYGFKDSPGLSAAIYTQITDVEIECNGLLTYDRAVIKPDEKRIAAANRGEFPKREITVMRRPVSSSRNTFFVSNRDPLVSGGFVKLPIGSITPRGWLRNMLELEKEGLTGKLSEISPWLNFEKSAWTNPQGTGERGWEEMPYWLKGFGDLGYVLKDESIIREARRWIEGILTTQREDGWFGPRELLTSLQGMPDLWPNMVVLNILQSYHEYSNDPRILPFMKKYFKWQNQLDPKSFGAGYWPKLRAGDNIESVYWLYNRTGESWLLDLAKKIHDNMARWQDGVINGHNVNVAQGFREPGVYYSQAKDARFLDAAERNYRHIMGIYGQFPGGGFAADENARPGFIDPRQGFETCGIVEFMHSFQMLTKISGDPVWADRCEDIAFNSFTASMTPDLKGLHYLNCANQVQLDKNSKAPGVYNNGTMFSYSPLEVYRCCQHNVSHGWPYYAEELWLATYDRGLCASLYSASEVKARVGDGTTVTVIEETDYPFNDRIRFTIKTPKRIAFPLYLRVPGWCHAASVQINGKTASDKADSLSYIVMNRTWSNNDVVTLSLPMGINVRTWEKNMNSVSLSYGPIFFSLKIDERWERYGKNERWPEWEVYPASPWNYGLPMGTKENPPKFVLMRKDGPLAFQPFAPDSVPLWLNAKARKIANWQMDSLNLVGLLQQSPARSDEPEETISLIPMGAARLRISSFPTVVTGNEGRDWMPPAKQKINK